MSLVSATLFLQNNRDYFVGGLTFDLLMSENHEFSGNISQYNIEDGSNISDHIENNPKGGSLTGFVSNFSLNNNSLINNAQDAFDLLEEIHDAKELVTVSTIHKVYDNVFISNISVSRDKDTGEALMADITFTEVTIVKLQEVAVTVSITNTDVGTEAGQQASNNLDAGKQSGTPITTGGLAFTP